jgi:hypothetical protein
MGFEAMSFMDREQLSGIPQREERRARLVRGSLRMANGTVIPILVRNLSERGLGMACKTKPPQRGEAVIVTLPGSPELDGVVRWVRDRDFGVALQEAIDIDELYATIREEIARARDAAEWDVRAQHRVQVPHSVPRRVI